MGVYDAATEIGDISVVKGRRLTALGAARWANLIYGPASADRRAPAARRLYCALGPLPTAACLPCPSRPTREDCGRYASPRRDLRRTRWLPSVGTHSPLSWTRPSRV